MATSGSASERGEKPKSNEPDRDPNAERDIGAALRAAYEEAVAEDIPAEILDLLNKLR